MLVRSKVSNTHTQTHELPLFFHLSSSTSTATATSSSSWAAASSLIQCSFAFQMIVFEFYSSFRKTSGFACHSRSFPTYKTLNVFVQCRCHLCNTTNDRISLPGIPFIPFNSFYIPLFSIINKKKFELFLAVFLKNRLDIEDCTVWFIEWKNITYIVALVGLWLDWQFLFNFIMNFEQTRIDALLFHYFFFSLLIITDQKMIDKPNPYKFALP